MEFHTITKEEPKSIMTFETVIKKRILLKAKLKLAHIVAFDKDLESLEKNGLSLSELNLSDFKIDESYHLIVPVSPRIIRKDESLKLKSYLIYLSYLYNFDLLTLQKEEPVYFYRFLFRLNLPEIIRRNLFSLLEGEEGVYFTTFYQELTSSNFRSVLYETSKSLSRYQKKYN